MMYGRMRRGDLCRATDVHSFEEVERGSEAVLIHPYLE